MRWTGLNLTEIAKFAAFSKITEISEGLSGDDLYIKTLEGEMHVSLGDWIILGVKKELYPCKPDIFEMTYEEVTA